MKTAAPDFYHFCYDAYVVHIWLTIHQAKKSLRACEERDPNRSISSAPHQNHFSGALVSWTNSKPGVYSKLFDHVHRPTSGAIAPCKILSAYPAGCCLMKNTQTAEIKIRHRSKMLSKNLRNGFAPGATGGRLFHQSDTANVAKELWRLQRGSVAITPAGDVSFAKIQRC